MRERPLVREAGRLAGAQIARARVRRQARDISLWWFAVPSVQHHTGHAVGATASGRSDRARARAFHHYFCGAGATTYFVHAMGASSATLARSHAGCTGANGSRRVRCRMYIHVCIAQLRRGVSTQLIEDKCVRRRISRVACGRA
jgi:hypothetical protein